MPGARRLGQARSWMATIAVGGPAHAGRLSALFPYEVQIIVEDQHLTEEAKRRTLWDNAADLFHI